MTPYTTDFVVIPICLLLLVYMFEGKPMNDYENTINPLCKELS
jgi:hypothetical protein